MKKSNLLIFLLFLMIPFAVNSSNVEEKADYTDKPIEMKDDYAANLGEETVLINQVELLNYK